MPSAPTPATYHTLRGQVEQILSSAKDHARQATEWERVDTYWRIGDAIYVYTLDRGSRAEYGQKIIAKLSNNLQLGKALLRDMVRFRRAFSILYPRRQLAWKHYRMLTASWA